MLSTTGREQEARSIARQLVEERLAACVNILGPIRSVYCRDPDGNLVEIASYLPG